MKKLLFLLLLSLGINAPTFASEYRLLSPDGKIEINLSVGEDIRYSVSKSGELLLAPSTISMTLDGGKIFGQNDKVLKIRRAEIKRTIEPIVYKKSTILEHYNELCLEFKEYRMIFRAYNEGAAYRFAAKMKREFIVREEQASFNFPKDFSGYFPYSNAREGTPLEEQVNCSFENTYSVSKISEFDSSRLAFLPITLKSEKGTLICITESDLVNYPGMFLHNNDGGASLYGVWARYPDKVEIGGHDSVHGIVKSRFPYIARASAKEEFPWRMVILASEDKDLLSSDMPWLLGSSSEEGSDYSWVKPGKVAWEWWCANNLYGVDFRTGINNDTYKYFIDFAASKGIEYIMLDGGWAVQGKTDLFQVVPEIDIQMLCDYAYSKGVGIILWAGYKAFEKDMEKACREYSKMGVRGFKIDYLDRDDQEVIAFCRKAAETAAKYHLLIDFHGTSKPAGLQRTYPNVLNFEGVHGLEWMKMSEHDQVTYDVTLPFTRMVAGPIDYTQGAMRNASKENFRKVKKEPMSQGTRCRQLAEYVVFDSPLNMLCDSPSSYLAEPECIKFISECPVTWDEIVPLEGKIGEYVAVAKRKGDTWYVGAMTSWSPRTLPLDLSFLSKGDYSVELFLDGINADKVARDFKHISSQLPSSGILEAPMAHGGGFAAIIRTNK